MTVKKGTTLKFVWNGKHPHNVVVAKGPKKFRSKTQTKRLLQGQGLEEGHLQDHLRDPPRDEPEGQGQVAPRDAAAGGAEVASAPPVSAATARKIRVVVAKPGLDGHDRGAKIIARALRDAGMEVIYTGLHQTPEQIVETVIQEDADAVGLSILSGAHMTLVPRIVELLHEQGIDDVVVTVGGTIPGDDIPELKRLGVAEVFTPGAPTQAIIDFIQDAVAARTSR